jgi:peptidoglycan/xylan/chitin deacetylase (PgdA/CDA1 family)
VVEWPGGPRGALCLSFDNLGEAAEIELGALPPDAPLGEHFTATRVLPALLDSLRERNLVATFFVEGLNAELYPEALEAIAADGHEIAYHAWRHEKWGDLSAAEQAENLRRGGVAFEALGLTPAGLRPPGGQLGPGGVEVLSEAGLRYCSPAGEGAGNEDGIALLPFQWRHVDASCVLPPLAAVRAQMTGSPDPIEPDAFLAYLQRELGRLAADGGFLTIVLHLSMLEWLGWDRLGALLDDVSQARQHGELWVARCDQVAGHILDDSGTFQGGVTLDPTSWSG